MEGRVSGRGVWAEGSGGAVGRGEEPDGGVLSGVGGAVADDEAREGGCWMNKGGTELALAGEIFPGSD